MAQQRRSTKANLRPAAGTPAATAMPGKPGSGAANPAVPGRPPSGPAHSSPAMQRPPTGSAISPQAGTPQRGTPGPTGTQIRAAKRTPGAPRKAAPSSGVMQSPEAAAPRAKGGGREGGAEIGRLHRRGWSLSFKFTFFIVLVVVLVTALFGVVAINELRDKLLTEIVRTGYDQTITAKAFAQKITNRFSRKTNKDGSDRVPSAQTRAQDLKDYKADDNIFYKEDKELLREIVKHDPRIYDVAIFVSETPTSDPSQLMVNGGEKIGSFHSKGELVLLPGNIEPHKDITVFWADYNGERCLNFRMPIEKDPSDPKNVYSALKLAVSASQIDAEVRSTLVRLGLIGTILLLVCLGLAHFLANHATRPINTLVEDMDIVSKGDLDHKSQVPNQTSDEIGLLAMAFNRMTANLKAARELERDSERIASELQTAQAIHAKLMPEKLPQLPGLDIFTAYHCAKEVGGDYYDFIPVGDAENLALCVADVSGKGIPGSMVMGFTRTILRMMAMNNHSAADVLAKTNFHVARDIKRGMFVTCVYAILNVRTKEMTVASAGHNPMLIYRAQTGQIEKVRPNGIALGFDKGPVFNRTVKEQKVKLYSGDRVVLYTDGVVEAMNEAREEWTDEKLDEFTLQHATLPSKEYVRLLIKALEDHKGNAEQHDDITVSTFRVS